MTNSVGNHVEEHAQGFSKIINYSGGLYLTVSYGPLNSTQFRKRISTKKSRAKTFTNWFCHTRWGDCPPPPLGFLWKPTFTKQWKTCFPAQLSKYSKHILKHLQMWVNLCCCIIWIRDIWWGEAKAIWRGQNWEKGKTWKTSDFVTHVLSARWHQGGGCLRRSN